MFDEAQPYQGHVYARSLSRPWKRKENTCREQGCLPKKMLVSGARKWWSAGGGSVSISDHHKSCFLLDGQRESSASSLPLHLFTVLSCFLVERFTGQIAARKQIYRFTAAGQQGFVSLFVGERKFPFDKEDLRWALGDFYGDPLPEKSASSSRLA